MTPEERKAAKRLKFEQDISWTNMPVEMEKIFGHTFSKDAIRDSLKQTPEYTDWQKNRNQEKTTDNIQAEVLKALEKEQTIKELCDRFKISERILQAVLDDIKESGFDVNEDDGILKINKTAGTKQGYIKENWNGEKLIRFGLISDTHLCSQSQQLTHLNSMYDTFKSEGIETVYHCGDIVDGDDVYPGHRFEVFLIGTDNQKKYCVKNYPIRKGIKTKFITGNHDLKWFIKMGYDIGETISKERADLIYLGQYFARVELTPNCILQLEHPLGKPAYAVSYKTQRKIDNMRGGDKPNILAEGHYHYSNEMFRRNVHAYCVPSFQGQTKFAKRMGLESDNGGYIIDINVDDDGTITKISHTFYPFYKPIINDY
jgi:predicted phosphodiesterase